MGAKIRKKSECINIGHHSPTFVKLGERGLRLIYDEMGRISAHKMLKCEKCFQEEAESCKSAQKFILLQPDLWGNYYAYIVHGFALSANRKSGIGAMHEKVCITNPVLE